jgi:hypothetical protein
VRQFERPVFLGRGYYDQWQRGIDTIDTMAQLDPHGAATPAWRYATKLQLWSRLCRSSRA